MPYVKPERADDCNCGAQIPPAFRDTPSALHETTCAIYDVQGEDSLDVAYYVRADTRYLRTAIGYAEAYGGCIQPGTKFSPSDRALPHGEHVWQNGTPEEWDEYSYSMLDASNELGLYWDEGCLWIAPDADDYGDDVPPYSLSCHWGGEFYLRVIATGELCGPYESAQAAIDDYNA